MFATTLARTLVSAAGAVLIGGACLVAATAPAAAATPSAATMVIVTKTVSYADLDLSRPEGRATLDARIKAAAKSVCETGNNDLASRLSEVRCVRSAITTARS